MLLYTDPCFLEHDTGSHPEKAERLRRVTAHLEQQGLPRKCQLPEWRPVSLERLARVHTEKYAGEVRQFALQRGGYIEADTVVSEKSYDVALRAAGAVCDAVERVVRGDDTRALCLVRPPGHHALPGSAMGFCLFNNVAIAARSATAEWELNRVLIVDWDVHHGNGTQDTFWEDPQVSFLSIHRWPFYPGTGKRDETGKGKGLGTTLNLPTAMGTPRREYLTQFQDELERFADKHHPELILISAGFDSHKLDPIGSLGLEVEDFSELTAIVMNVAATHSGGKLVSVLEGGYNVDVLPLCVEAHLSRLLEA